jgi:hypothetical protein
MLDRDDVPGAQREQGPRQSARTGADLDDRGVFERAGRARDPDREIEVERVRG